MVEYGAVEDDEVGAEMMVDEVVEAREARARSAVRAKGVARSIVVVVVVGCV